jgi:hypothetical protein
MATVKVNTEMVQQALRETDWAAVDAQTDEDIARNVASDPDAAPILSEGETAILWSNRHRNSQSSRVINVLSSADVGCR